MEAKKAEEEAKAQKGENFMEVEELKMDVGVGKVFDYDGCTYEDFIIQVSQDAPWNKPYIVEYWEQQAPSEADLEDYQSDINNMVETITRFNADDNQTVEWASLTHNIQEHAVKFKEYWLEKFYGH